MKHAQALRRLCKFMMKEVGGEKKTTNSPCISYRFVSVSLGQAIVASRNELLKDEIGQLNHRRGLFWLLICCPVMT